MLVRGTVTLVFVALVASCAPKSVTVPTVGAPKYPDFLLPEVPSGLAGGAAAVHQERAWRFLQSGDLRNAAREVAAARIAAPAFFPADATSGYVALAGTDAEAALGHFGRALEQRRDYVSALHGRGLALEALGRDDEAVEAFQAALANAPSLTSVQRRIEVLRFRGTERAIASARESAKASRPDAARTAYLTAIERSPDSAFLHRELAALERAAGNAAAALDHLRRAVALDGSDAASFALMGELLESAADVEGALKAYADALALEPSGAVSARRDALLGRLELARLPEEYRAIDAASELTRAQLAALIGIRLQAWVQRMPIADAGVITDIRGTWAETWIMSVVRAGIMEAFANHTFQPAVVVRRADLAAIADRLLPRLAPREQLTRWQSASLTFADLLPGHLAYPAAATAVASGVVTLAADGMFQPYAAVSGREAVSMVERLQRLAAGAGVASAGR